MSEIIDLCYQVDKNGKAQLWIKGGHSPILVGNRSSKNENSLTLFDLIEDGLKETYHNVENETLFVQSK